MTINIEIIGKKLSIRTNTGNKGIIEDFDFEPFSQLLEQDEIFIGITASMNQNKKITINDFSLSEISIMEKGDFIGGKSNYTAGETISLFFSIKSICGKLLKIYPNEYSSSNENDTNVSLIINNDVEAPAKIIYTFNDTTTTLRFDISRIKTGTYTALVKFKDNYSSPVQFTINPGSVQRFEICYDKENIVNEYYDSSNLDQTKETFIVPICAYDQYNNSRKIELPDIKNLISVLYPHYVHTNNGTTFVFIDNEIIYYKIPFTTFGQYQIFNPNFMQNSTRIFNLTVNNISPEKTDATILYGKHLVKDEDEAVTLRLKLRDEFGRDIPNSIIKEMGCNFDESYVANDNNENIFDGINSSIMEVQYEKSDIIHLVFNPKDLGYGKYTFVPKIKCRNDLYDLTLKCSETEIDENSIYDKCAFYKVSSSSEFNSDKIRIYSDFLNEYIYLNSGSNNDKLLLVSLDEGSNKKLTEINLLDKSEYPIVDPTSNSISCILDSDILNVKNVGNFFSVELKKERTSYDNTLVHTLKITVQYSTYNINVKFVSVDKILNNMFRLSGGSRNPIAFYQQESYTIKASKNILLFEVYNMNSFSYLIKDSSIKSSDFEIKINGNSYTKSSGNNEVIFTEKEYSVLISTNLFTEEKTYEIELKVDSSSIVQNLKINVVASEEVNKIMNEKNEAIDLSFPFKEEFAYFYLGDKYGNRIKDNNAILSFSKLEISSNGLKAQINMDGKLFIFSENSSSNENSIIIKLPTGISYTIIQKKDQKEQKINPHKSYGLLGMDSPEIKLVDTTISVNVYLYDDDGNEIISNNVQKEEIENFDVYMIEKFGNKKKFISLNEYRIISGSNTINFSAKIYNVGEYEIKIFYKNIRVSCKACNYVVSASKSTENMIPKLFIVGNKRKIPVFYNNEYPQFLSKKKNFIFYIQFYDKYDNEITVNSQYSLTLNSADRRIKLCHYSNSKQEGKQFYHICSDQLNNFYNLPEGIYSIEVNAKQFSFYVSDKEVDDSNIEPKKVVYHQYENEVYGTTDSVMSLIVDLRNDKNMRMNLNNILSKISINLTDSESLDTNYYNADMVLGPDKGLFTLLLNIKKVGNYSLEILYDGKSIKSKDLQVIISCGAVNGLQNLSDIVYYSGVGTYSFYQVKDVNNEKCNYLSNNSWNVFNNDNYVENLIKAMNTKSNKYISTTKYYNHMKGVLTVMISSDINDDVALSSNIFTLDETISQSTLSKEKVNKEYLYAELDDTNRKVKLIALKKIMKNMINLNLEATKN